MGQQASVVPSGPKLIIKQNWADKDGVQPLSLQQLGDLASGMFPHGLWLDMSMTKRSFDDCFYWKMAKPEDIRRVMQTKNTQQVSFLITTFNPAGAFMLGKGVEILDHRGENIRDHAAYAFPLYDGMILSVFAILDPATNQVHILRTDIV